MASLPIQRTCAANNTCRQTGIAICEGCSQSFCGKHFPDHRHFLGKEMNEIMEEYNHFENSLNEHRNNPDSHSLVKQIKEWEQQSINKIHQRAKELRSKLYESTNVHVNELLVKLHCISEELNEYRKDNAFTETDFGRWKESLSDLKLKFISSSTITINQHSNFFPRQIISVGWKMATDLLEQVSDNNVQIEENGQVAIHDDSEIFTEIRGKNQYASGCHKIYIKIEHPLDRWMFLGVTSKLSPLQNTSHNSQSSYGWSSNNLTWSNGQCYQNRSNAVEMKRNDIIMLNFDCDQHIISITNENTKTKHELNVNINNCPLPWQLHVNLYQPKSKIRILSTDYTF
jgi:hypothetical protein